MEQVQQELQLANAQELINKMNEKVCSWPRISRLYPQQTRAEREEELKLTSPSSSSLLQLLPSLQTTVLRKVRAQTWSFAYSGRGGTSSHLVESSLAILLDLDKLEMTRSSKKRGRRANLLLFLLFFARLPPVLQSCVTMCMERYMEVGLLVSSV